ncbi:hypothetical protein FGIG_05578 [Fasciola gigantica]|uniref:Uncharacterized protein n=1 Tax=Fasciola gigantica TaxID=46835 RepID=A0A504Y6S8_FASGI|nr:hypothetical protein FGIG_05578 [Fasciola gigantica]
MRFHRTSLPPPPKESPPPTPLSPILSPIVHPSTIHQAIHPGTRIFPEEPRSPQPTRVTPRPRVPRMGTCVSPAQSSTFGMKTDSGQVEFSRTTRLAPLRSPVLIRRQEEKHLTKCLSTRAPLVSKLVATPSPIRSLVSSARETSNAVSSDLRRFFRRPAHVRNHHRLDPRTDSLNRGRLTPISERTNTSSPSTKQSYFSDYSLSDSEMSDATETTNLSLTWPLSRSQTDLSSKLYCPYAKIPNIDQLVVFPTQPKQPNPKGQPLNALDPSSGTNLPTTNLTGSPGCPMVKLPSTKVAELKQWMTEIDQDEIMRRFKRMRIVTMTARRWTIKRRPDGTRYLAYRRSHTSRCQHHNTDAITETAITHTENPNRPVPSHRAANDAPENRSSVNNSDLAQSVSVSECTGRCKRYKSHRSGQNGSQPSTTFPLPFHRPESFPPLTTTHGKSSHRSSPREETQQNRASVVRSALAADNISATTAKTTSASGNARSSAHRCSRHRARRPDGVQDSGIRIARNASCCLNRISDTRTEMFNGERTYVYYMAVKSSSEARSHDRIRNVNFCEIYPTARSRADSADSDSTKLVTMLVV